VKYFIGIILSLSLSSPVAKAETAYDVGVTNKERIEYWLNKNKNLSNSELSKQLDDYLYSDNAITSKTTKVKQGFKYPNTRVFQSDAKTEKVSLLNNESDTTADDTINTVKVLAILVDFPDLPHAENQLIPEDTDMYYSSYSIEHYEALLFNKNGFTGPNNEVLQTAYDYYQQASGQSLNFTGNVYGWVTADKNASTYGERQGVIRDIAAPDLVKEAVEKAVTAYNIDLTEYDLTDLDDIDGDGITNEPNGIIDHVMIFHSSVGEEAGGGYLGTDAIWSHRYYVFDEQSQPATLSSSDIKLFGYTINPIDASIGVVVHEFGHDLGLADEYDLRANSVGEPVANWSVMSRGSYAGELRGSEPVAFSAFALDYLQTRYKGNWINQRSLAMNEVNENATQALTYTSNASEAFNQLKVTSPKKLTYFKAPVEGAFQFYSGMGDNLSHRFAQTVTLPATDEALTLEFIAFHSIEDDYDFVQVKVNGTPISGNYTQALNPYYGDIGPYISGDSFSNPDSQQPNNHLNYTFDLSAYNGQAIELSIEYFTDTLTHYYGFVFDDAKITSGADLVWQNTAEQASDAELSGFSRISQYIFEQPTHYFMQLRSYTGIDSGLEAEQYSPGLLLWFSSEAFSDNNVTTHPGEGFALVVDADQQQINEGTTSEPAETTIQIRDGAFSLYEQTSGLSDTHLLANSEFDDSNDYSFSEQTESGVVLPNDGFSFKILNQDTDSQNIELLLSYESEQNIIADVENLTVNFSMTGIEVSTSDTVLWDFGDGEFSHELSPTHTYLGVGSYYVALTVTASDESFESSVLPLTLSDSIKIDETNYSVSGAILSAAINHSGGTAPYTYLWEVGEGTTLSTSSITHTYSLSGEYDVNVTVTDKNNDSASDNIMVSVQVPLEATASVSTSNLNATFSAEGSGGFGQYTYSWDFGDGTQSSTLQNPTHTYTSAGTYNAILTMTDTMSNAQIIKTLNVSVANQQTSSGSSGGGLGLLLLLISMGCVVRRIHI
jgi:immune inhibitor A